MSSAEARSDQSAPLDVAVQSAIRTLGTEGDGLRLLQVALAGPLAEPFTAAVDLLASLNGRAIVTGIGKSGHIARKMASTFASTGTPAFYMHPAEASHGDLGMVTDEDAVIALSWSGETSELKDTITYCGRHRVRLIGLTSNRDSALGRAADVVIELPMATEACPHGLAPTTSAVLQLAIGDAMAVALLEKRGFTPANFRRFHPGGKLGSALLTVRDVMKTGADVSTVMPDSTVQEVILSMTGLSLGCSIVVDAQMQVLGIITDGDLRRHASPSLLGRLARDVMTPRPTTISADVLASAALARMAERRIADLVVVDKQRLVGLITMHRLIDLGLS
jgi:arabinose-5-phosphate isomerase